jgi:hypothetical protein
LIECPGFQIIITPPVAMPIEAMERPERVGPRLAEIETLVRTNT